MTLEELRAAMQTASQKMQSMLAENDGDLSDEQQTAFDSAKAEFETAKRKYDNAAVAEQAQQALNAPATPAPKAAPNPNLIDPQDASPDKPLHISAPHVKLQAFKGAGAEERAHRAGMWARAYLFGDIEAHHWCQSNGVGHPDAVLKTTGNAGAGYLIPEEFSTAIIDNRDEFGLVRQHAQILPMSRDSLAVPCVVNGTTASWVGEGNSLPEGDPKFTAVNLTARKLGVLTRVTTEMAEDSAINLADWLAMDFARAFAEAEDDAAFNGDGTSSYGGIYGALAQMDANESWSGVYTAAANHDQFTEIDAADLAGTIGSLPMYAFSRDPAWYVSQRGHALIFERLAASGGGQNTLTMREGLGFFYGGFPIRVSPKLPTSTGDLSEKTMLLFGSLRSAVLLGDRQQIRVQTLLERYADTDEIGIRATERVDIAVHSLGDDNTAGPLVGLMGD